MGILALQLKGIVVCVTNKERERVTSSGIPALKQKEAAAVCLRHQQRQLVPLFVRSTFTSRQSAPSVCGELARSAATLHTTRLALDRGPLGTV